MMQVRAILSSYYGRQIWNTTEAFEWCHSQWSWV